MKRLLFILLLLSAPFLLSAQTNSPAKLAIIAESSGAEDVASLLTAELSSNSNLHLLERDEIDRIAHEQGLSLVNQNYLKLGQLLGADGLLLIDGKYGEQIQVPFGKSSPQILDLTSRLIAVKPGVVLSAEKFTVKKDDLADWTSTYVKHLDPFLPKLTLLVKDAIPISVVNFRCAAASTNAAEVERQLKLLAIERLSQERQCFVLERQRMQLLTQEKEFNLDDSQFWSGCYLLEGVVDQNGYDEGTVTINARLTPPKGSGVPLLMEIRGSRSNLPEVINQLVTKVAEALKIGTTAPSWNPSAEATQYYEEAKWALRWEAYGEAQTAAESAWALGKRDSDCGLLRVQSYAYEIPAIFPSGSFRYDPNRPQQKYGHLDEALDPKFCDTASYGLTCYYECLRSYPDGEPKILTRGKGWNDWHDSPWYLTGIESLNAASGILQYYNYLPSRQTAMAEKLSDLRSITRKVANLISESPSVHDSYYISNRSAGYDELSKTLGENPNIFRCEVNWGCFWQEKPEDTIAMYRQLMSSPVFSYIHADFWNRPEERPRLMAWNDSDSREIPIIWNNFMRELADSPDILHQLEYKGLVYTDAQSDTAKHDAFTNFYESLIGARQLFITNDVDIFYLDWGTSSHTQRAPSEIVTDFSRSIEETYRKIYHPQLNAIFNERIGRPPPPVYKAPELIAQEKEYLKANQYDSPTFNRIFLEGSGEYSKSQALELEPFVAEYKSNLSVQIDELKRREKIKALSSDEWMNESDMESALSSMDFFVGRAISNAIHPQPPPVWHTDSGTLPSSYTFTAQFHKPANITGSDAVSNVLTVGKFYQIPLHGLCKNGVGSAAIVAHHWIDGKLLLDLAIGTHEYTFDQNSNWTSTANVTYPAFAILDPVAEHWNVILGQREGDILAQNLSYNRSTLWHDRIFTSDNHELKTYDLATRQWRTLEISDGNNYQLFNVNDRLYAANATTVLEIIDNGNATHLMASTRRQAPVTALDTVQLGNPYMGLPMLCPGPANSLRIITREKIYAWAGSDWRYEADIPGDATRPEILPDGILFRGPNLYRLPYQSDELQVCIQQAASFAIGGMPLNIAIPAQSGSRHSLKTTWDMPAQFVKPMPQTWLGEQLYFLQDHSQKQDIVQQMTDGSGKPYSLITGSRTLEKDGANAELLCFSPGSRTPQKVFLRFSAPHGRPPGGENQAFMYGAAGAIYFGDETTAPMAAAVGTSIRDDFLAQEFQPGIWMMPVSVLQTQIGAQRKAQLAAAAQQAAAKEQLQKNILDKYSHGRQGAMNPEEKENALTNADFISSQIDIIDANHNGLLDPDELSYFDTRHDGYMNRKEQAGFDLAQHLLATRLIEKFDKHGDGFLDLMAFQWMLREYHWSAVLGTLPRGPHGPYCDADHLAIIMDEQLLIQLGHPRNPGTYGLGDFGAEALRDQIRYAIGDYWEEKAHAAKSAAK